MALKYSPRAAATRQKMLRLNLWVITTKNVAPLEELSELLEAHLDHQIRLEKDGVLFGAGPLSHPDGSSTGTGLIIIRAASEAEARRIADQDPFHSFGLRTYSLQQWSLNEGRVCIAVDFSDQSYRFA